MVQVRDGRRRGALGDGLGVKRRIGGETWHMVESCNAVVEGAKAGLACGGAEDGEGAGDGSGAGRVAVGGDGGGQGGELGRRKVGVRAGRAGRLGSGGGGRGVEGRWMGGRSEGGGGSSALELGEEAGHVIVVVHGGGADGDAGGESGVFRAWTIYAVRAGSARAASA